LTSGAPLFGNAGFEVPEIVPVIYLAAEVSERSLKQRIKKFGITDDKEKFLCRTISSIGGAGNMNLTDKYLLEAISATKPIVILDVLQCFSTAEDENDAAENKNLRYMIDSLRARGARAIIVLHHSTKNFKEKPTKENAVRGSGDILGGASRQRAGVTDANPEDKIGDVEGPKHGPVQAPHAKTVVDLIAKGEDAREHHAPGDPDTQPVSGAALKQRPQQISANLLSRFFHFPRSPAEDR
jgi:RecA-family ATPase